MRPLILVVGSINTDFSARGAKLPLPGETIEADEFHVGLGGKGTNQAVAATRLGARVGLLGRVGADDRGQDAIGQIRAEGVDVSWVAEVDGVPTGAALIAVDSAGEKMIVVVPGANGRLTAADMAESADIIRSAAVVVAQLEVPVEAVLAAFRIAKAAGGRTVLDPAPARPLPDELYTLTDAIKPNGVEVRVLTGIAVRDRETARAAAKILLARGVGMAIVPGGDDGDLLVTADSEHWLPRFMVNAIDATGAGDAFVGALAVALVEGQSLEAAGSFASATAALATTRFGAVSGLPSRAEVQTLVMHGTAS